MSRPRALILLLLVATGAGACGERGESPAGPLEVAAMSFNVRWDGFDDGPNGWEHRRGLVFETIRRAEPDVVGLQESSDRQVREIVAALPRYRAFDAGERSGVVSVLYRADRFRLERGGGIWLVEESELSGGTRRCTWVLLVEIGTGLRFYHLNLHLDHRSLPSRERSVVVLTRHLAEREPADPFVVTGDFNTGEQSPPMRFLRGEIPLPDEGGRPFENPVPVADSFRLLFPDAERAGTASGFAGRRDGAKIDHVLVPTGARVLEARILRDDEDGRHPSDHFPVFARVRFGGR